MSTNLPLVPGSTPAPSAPMPLAPASQPTPRPSLQTRASGVYAAPTTRDIDRHDRRQRLTRLVTDADIYESEAQRHQAIFVADAVCRRADSEFISRHPSEAFPGHILNALKSVANRAPDVIQVGCSRPKKATHGYDLPMFVLETCMADQPFIIDTIKLALRRIDIHTLGTLNMILPIERDADGHLLDIGPDKPRVKPESFSCHLLSTASVGERAQLVRQTVRWHLEHAARITADFRMMRKLLRDVLSTLQLRGEGRLDANADFAEARAFGEWLMDDHFVFMGAYGFDAEGAPTAGRLGLAHFSQVQPGSTTSGVEGDPVQAFSGKAPLVSIHQSRVPSPVHRDAPLVEVRMRLFDQDGNPDGGVVFQGLFTYKAVTGRASSVPFLRHRLSKMVALEDLVPSSHRMKVFLSFFDRLPLTFTFSASDKAIVALINEAIDVDFGGAPRVYYRINQIRTGAQVFVLLSQDRYGDEVRHSVQEYFKKAFAADEIGFRLLVGKTDTVMLDFLLFADRPLQAPDASQLSDTVVGLVSPWLETMRDTLRTADMDENEVDRLCLLYGEAFPETYHHHVEPRHLVEDFQSLQQVRESGRTRIMLRQDSGDVARGSIRLLMYTPTDIALTDILPVIDHFGLRVLGETTMRIEDAEGEVLFFESYRIAADTDHGPHLLARGDAFIEAMHAVLDGRMNSSSLNRLLLPAGLSWRQLAAMRAYLGYARQLGTAFPANLVQQVLLNQPELARTLIDLFDARFEPFLGGSQVVGRNHEQRLRRVREVQERFAEQLKKVQDAVEDKVLRMFANFIHATLRTNFFQRPGEARALSFKFRCSEVELMPEPRPMFEIFVYDPRVEGVHLRGGKVARGGLRWSDRIDDFRTEVLSLMQTQMVKNTLIVPVGSKGGFVLKKPERDDQARRRQADELYQVFINGLLDVTDNFLEGKAIFPDDVVVYDEADPYLVVAADKGTAHLSDTANGIALERGFWLGDAFASGGSKGYDHKLYGITAKGAWVCVQRHFREMGVDIQKDPFTVFGIGDMSGDVFGNGMLLSRTIRLLAAYDHRHIFLDPNPDPEVSFVERERLFKTPRSSWAMYETAKISQGGGVFPRTAKSIALSAEVQAMLGVQRDEMSGDELMHEILRMDVDLFWNGGIGTFVKASHETHVDVGDKTNDAIRVDATELRCKVVGEGGNLGFTQAARVEFALRTGPSGKGGHIYTDAVDNSAGVDLSDHEVNLKILFAPLLQAGQVDFETRDKVLLSIDEAVCRLVVYNNYQQSLGISVAEMRSAAQMRDWGDVVRFLVDAHGIDQEVQMLPSKLTLTERRKAGVGLTRPELARITAFAKMWVYNELVADKERSTGTDAKGRGPATRAVEKDYLDYYFPENVRLQYQGAIDRHMLRHEIVSTLWTNALVDFGSALLLPRLAMEFDRPVPDLCQAHTFSLRLLGIPRLREALMALDAKVPTQVQYEAFAALEDEAAAATQWLLATFPGENLFEFLATGAEVQAWAQGLAPQIAAAQTGSRHTEAMARAAAWTTAGMPAQLAKDIAGLEGQAHLFAIWQLARETGANAQQAVAVYFATADITGLAELLAQIDDATPQTRWEAAALASLGQGLGYTLFRLAVRVAQSLPGGATREKVRGVLVDELKLGALWDLANQIQAEGVQIPALVVLTEKLRARLR